MLTNLNLTDMETCYKAIRGDLARSHRAAAHGRSLRLRAGDHGAARQVGRAHLRGADQLLRPHLRGRQEDRLEGRRRGVLAHHASSICSHERSVSARDGQIRLIAVLALASSIRRHRQPIHVRRPVHRRAQSDRCTASQDWWRAFATIVLAEGLGRRRLSSADDSRFQAGVRSRAAGIRCSSTPSTSRCMSRRACSCSRSRSGCCQLWAAWIAAALFAVHPVHVEAVANVVGQAELLVAATLISATFLYVRDRQCGVLRSRPSRSSRCCTRSRASRRNTASCCPRFSSPRSLTIIEDETPWRARIRDVRPFFSILDRDRRRVHLGAVAGARRSRRHRWLPAVHAVQHVAHQRIAIACSRRSVSCRSG